MAQATWSGTVRLGLLNVPIKLYTAVDEQKVSFRQLHSKCNTPISMVRQCGACEKDVAFGDIVKGYEITSGRFVRIEPGELEALMPEASRTMTIDRFVDMKDIDPLLYEKSYFLGPEDKNAEHSYLLLAQALERSRKAAVGSFVMRSRQYPFVMHAREGRLIASTLRFDSQVRSLEQAIAVSKTELPEKEIEMALTLVEQYSEDFDVSIYTDEYSDQVMELIQARSDGEKYAIPAAETEIPTIDLMAALETSIEAAKDLKQTKTGKKAAVTRKAKQAS